MPVSLELLESIATNESIAPTLLVGVYRSNEVDASHPFQATLNNIKASGVEIVRVSADVLDARATQDLVADVLIGEIGPPTAAQALIPLTRELHRRTEGNPFFVLQYLRRLCDAGALWSDRGAWQWDEAALAALPGSDNLVAGLLEELQVLPAEVRNLAGGCACLGGAIDVEILAAAMGTPIENVDAWLVPLLQRDVLLGTRVDATAAALSGAARSDEHLLRFCHDRMQQAAYGLLDDGGRQAWHLALARVLQERARAGELYATQRYVIASHYVAALAAVGAGAEAVAVHGLLVSAAQDAFAAAAHDAALHFIDAALALAARGDFDPGDPLDPAMLRHRVLCGLARHEDADAAYAQLVALAGDGDIRIAESVLYQVNVLAGRLQWREACELALRHVVQFGIELPSPDLLPEALNDEFDKLYRTLDERGLDVFDNLAPMTDPTAEAAVNLLTASIGPAMRWHPMLARWVHVRGLRLNLEHGHAQQTPGALCDIGLLLNPLRGDRRTSYRLAKSGLRMAARYGNPWRMARARIGASTNAANWFEPLETVLADMRPALRDLLEAGDGQYLAYAYNESLCEVTEIAPHLDVVEAELEAAFATSRRLRERYGPTTFVSNRQFVRCMRGQTRVLGGFEDDEVDEARLLASFGSNFPRGRALPYLPGPRRGAVRRLVAGAAFERLRAGGDGRLPGRLPEPDVELGARARALPGPARRDPRADRPPEDADRSRPVDRSVPGPCAGDAAQLRSPAWRAAGAARRCRRRFSRGGGRSRSGRAGSLRASAALSLRTRAGVARRLLHGARHATGCAWRLRRCAAVLSALGADGKVRQMQQRPLFEDVAATFTPLPSPEAEEPSRLELVGLAEAGQAMTEERDPERLPVLLFDLVRRYAAAERGRLYWHEEDGWLERAGFRSRCPMDQHARRRHAAAGRPAGDPGVGPELPGPVGATAAAAQRGRARALRP